MENKEERQQEIRMAVRIMRGSILVTEEFCKLFQSLEGQIAIVLIDDDGNKHPCLLNTNTHHLFNMEVWLRKYKPEANDSIIFILPSSRDLKSIRITLKSRHLDLQALTQQRENLIGEEQADEEMDTLYLGKVIKLGYYEKKLLDKKFCLSVPDLIRHVFICGTTGAGKTVFGKAIIEEAALKGIPSIVIDLKGDLSSLALVFSSLKGQEFQPWIEMRKGQDPLKKATLIADRHKKELKSFGVSEKDLKEYIEKVEVNVFTLKSSRGFKLGISPFTELPENILKIKEEGSDFYNQTVDFLTNNFVSLLGIKNQNKLKKAKGYLFELIKHALETKVNLQGYFGLINLIKLIEENPKEIVSIGARSIDSYISVKEREELANLINNLLTGASKMWFEGTPFNLDEMLITSNLEQKTPIHVINLKELDLEDRFFAVSQVATSILLWMQRQGGSGGEPRLIFYIDEIGAGGGKQAFFPSIAITPPKPALRQLLMQGRSYGVCCVFATQHPGDIDYKGLGECGTWVVGQLRTDLGRKKIKQGASTAEVDFNVAEKYIPALVDGELVVKTLRGEWSCVKERWLYCYHDALTYEQVGKIKEKYEKEATVLFKEGGQNFNTGNYKTAIEKYKAILSNFKYFSKVEQSRFQIGLSFYKMTDFDESIAILESIVTKCYDSEIVSNAQFYLAKCFKEKGDYSKAKAGFETVEATSKDINLVKQSEVLKDYCKKVTDWSALSLLKKVKLWFSRTLKPGVSINSVVQVDLDKEDEILEQEIKKTQLELKLPDVPNEIKVDELKWLKAEKDLEEEYKALRVHTYSDITKAKSLIENERVTEAKILYEKVIEKYVKKGLYIDRKLKKEVYLLNNKILEQKNRRQNSIINLDPFAFEIQIAKLYRNMNFSVASTPMTGDHGVDFFATRNNENFIIQCKHWSKPVGEPVIRDLLGTKVHFKADYAVLVTTSDFTDQAKRFASSHNIELINCEKLISMLLKSSV